MIGAHPRVVTKGKKRCKKCGRNHTLSEHWSHLRGTHKGAKGETAWYGRKPRPQGKRKIRKPAKRKARRKSSFKRGGTTFGPIRTTRTKRLKRMSVADMRASVRAAQKAARKAARKAAPRKRKKARTPAQKAATKRMLEGLARKRAMGVGQAIHAGRKGRRGSKRVKGIPMHLVHGHLAKNPGRKPGKHRVRAHKAADPGFGDIRPANRFRLG